MGELLDFKGKVDFTEARRDLAAFQKDLAKLGIAPAGGGMAKQFDVKPLTEYQAGQLKIKQQAADLAKQKYEDAIVEKKQKAEQVAADKAASLVMQAALKEEARIKREQIALEKQLAAERAKAHRVPESILSTTDSKVRFQNSSVRSESIINGERVARAKLNAELAREAVLNGDLTIAGANANRTTVQAIAATNQVVLSKKQLAKLLAEEKYIQAQATAELKNNAREMLNAKGSLEQRRAALIRLTKAYDQLSASERNSAAGQRLQGIVKGVSAQVLGLERETNRAQRNVGNYGASMVNTFSSIAASLGVTFSVAAIIQFGKELFGIAKKAEGVELAFSKIGDRKDLEKLRASVKDTVSDLQLMELAVRAEKFKIPMDVLAKGLEFSRQRAIDLGKDVDFMVDSFVNGIGRKSALVLDNLGISTSELQVEVRKTGDFVTAVGNIIDVEMAKGGIAVDTLADKSGRLATIWENLKKSAAGFFNSAKLNTDAIAEMTKAGNIDLNQSTYKTRLRLIEEQSGKMKKLASERIAQEQKIVDLQGKFGTGTQVNIEEAKLRKIIERQLAEKNIYNTMSEQSKALSEQDRQTKGLLSLDELREKAQQKRTDASQIIIRGKSDEDQIKKLNKEADALEKQANRFSEKTTQKQESEYQKQLKAAQSFSDKLTKFTADSSRKQMDSDEAEIQSVKDKYAAFKEEADRFYKDGNNVPVKINGKNVSRSEVAGTLKANEAAEIQSIIFKKEAADLKESLDKQAALYADFEELKTKIGEEKASERYSNQINTNKTYLEHLQKQEEDMLNPNKAKGGTAEDEVKNKAALKVLQERIAAAELIEQKASDDRYANAYNAAKTTAQALLEVEKEYQKNVKALGSTATQEQLDNLDKVRAKAASQIVVGDLTNSNAFTKLFGNLDELAASEISRLVKEIESKFSELSGSFDPIDLEVIRKKLNEAKAMIIKDNPFAQVGASIKAVFEDGADGATKSATQINKEWKNLADSTAGAFKFVDDAIQSCDVLKDAIGEVGSTALSSLSQITSAGIAVSRAVQLAGAASAAVAVTTATAIKTAEKASVILAIISAALTVVQAIAGLFKSIFNAHDKRVEKSIKGHQEQVDELGRAYNRLERDVNDAVGKAVEQAHLRQIENLKQQQAELAKIREAEQSKKKPDQNKINEVNDQIASIGDKIKDTQSAMIELLTGTTAKSISDGIIAGFKNGKRAAADFADDFNGLMEDALLQALKTDFLDVEIANFYKRFAEASKGGLTQDEVERLRTEYTSIIEEGLNLVKDIDKITGGPKAEAVSTEALKPNTLTASLNQPTAERLEGLWRGNFELTKQLVVQGQVSGLTMGEMLQIGRSKLAALERIDANTLRGANNTDGHTDLLNEIIKNTKPVKSVRD